MNHIRRGKTPVPSTLAKKAAARSQGVRSPQVAADPAVERARQSLLGTVLETSGGAPVRASPGQVEKDVARLQELMSQGPFSSYSAEEIRRCLEVEEPRFTRAYFQQHLEPRLSFDRPIDRMGEEPRFLFAAHLASFLMDAPEGETLRQALYTFRTSQLGPRAENDLWGRWFTLDDVQKLRQMYPFIPSWPGGVKPRSANVEAASAQPNDTTSRWVHTRIRELADIPMLCFGVQQSHQARPFDQGKMKGVRLVETAHALADKVGLIQGLISYDGMRGKDMTLVCKHYSASPVVVDVLRRGFGVNAKIVEGHHEVEKEVKEAITAAGAAAKLDKGSKLLLHIEGVHVWGWIRKFAEKNPLLKLAAVSHTTSDGRDLESELGRNFPIPITMMSLDSSKVNDERERFRRTIPPLLFRVADALNYPIYEARFPVMGYGAIMGPAAVKALDGNGLDYVVVDPDPDARARAIADGVPPERVLESLDSELDRRLVVINCAPVNTVSLEQRNRMSQSNIFINLGSGRAGFSAEEAAEQSKDESGRVRRTVVAWLGHQPVVKYHEPGKYDSHYDVGDGYVCNLSVPRPTVPIYSSQTNLLVLESLRETHHWLEKGKPGKHPITWCQIETAPREKPGREIRFFSRSEEPNLENLRFLVNGKHATREEMWAQQPDSTFQVVMSEEVVKDITRSIFGADLPTAPAS